MSRPNQVWVTLTGTRTAQTAKAVLFQVKQISGVPVELTTPNQWFPLSQVSKMTTDPNKVGADSIMVSEWILQQKDLLSPAARTPKVTQDDHGFDKIPEDTDWDPIDADDVPF